MNIFGIWAFNPKRSSNYLVRLELSKGSSGRGTLRPWPLLFAALQIPILPSFPSICNPLNLNVHFCLFIVADVFCCPFILIVLFMFICHNHFLFAAPCVLLAILVFILTITLPHETIIIIFTSSEISVAGISKKFVL